MLKTLDETASLSRPISAFQHAGSISQSIVVNLHTFLRIIENSNQEFYLAKSRAYSLSTTHQTGRAEKVNPICLLTLVTENIQSHTCDHTYYSRQPHFSASRQSDAKMATTFARPIQSIAALPSRGSQSGSHGTYTYDYFLDFKRRVTEPCPHHSWYDTITFESTLKSFVMQVYVIEDLWDEIRDEIRTVIRSDERNECLVECLVSQLLVRREISTMRPGSGRFGTNMTRRTGVRRTEEIAWLTEGIKLLTDPEIKFDPEYLRNGRGYPYRGGGQWDHDTVGGLKRAVMRCVLREWERQLRGYLERCPVMVGGGVASTEI